MWIGKTFLRFGNFSVISLNMLHIYLVCTSSPPSMLMIHRFGLLMKSLSSCIFLSQLLSWLSKISSVYSLSSFYFCILRFCLLVFLVCWSGLPLCFLFDYRDF
jgi:hypothetical protein